MKSEKSPESQIGLLGGFVLLSPEAGGDVLELASIVLAVEPLVGGGALQGAEVLEIWPYLDVVEIGLVDSRGDAHPSAVPRHLVLRVLLVDVLRQHVHPLGVAVAPHEGDTGDVSSVLIDKGIDGIGVQRQADVLPEIMAVTARTVTRATGDIDGQCHLVGYLLKHDAGVNVFQHHDQLAWA